MDKANFLKTEFPAKLEQIPADRKGAWGVLSAQGMIEHMTDSIAQGWGRIIEPSQTPPQFLEKAKSFAMSDKEFKPGTKNSLMGETPAPLRTADMNAAIAEIKEEINSFFEYWNNNPNAVITNPFFGDLNYSEWIHLLHKHAVHHLKQFGVAE